MVLLAYVDDLLVASVRTEDIDQVFAKLQSRWTLTLLGEATHILGLKIERDRKARRIYLSQTAYIERLSERFDTGPSRGARYAPLPTNHDERGDDELVLADAKPYQEMVGSLMWLAGCTRPDLAFTASCLARKSSSPNQGDMAMATRAISHAVQTRTMRLELGGDAADGLTAYVDSDWGGCRETRRSTTGYMSFLHGSPINWTSKRQATVASSSMEAEYIAAAEATKDVLWLRSLLGEIGLEPRAATTIHVDNQSAIKLASNPISHPRSKHIELRHHLVRERVADGTIELQYIPTGEQRADILTKALPGPIHSKIVQLVRLAPPDQQGGEGLIATVTGSSLRDRISHRPTLRDRIDKAREVHDHGPTRSKLRDRIAPRTTSSSTTRSGALVAGTLASPSPPAAPDVGPLVHVPGPAPTRAPARVLEDAPASESLDQSDKLDWKARQASPESRQQVPGKGRRRRRRRVVPESEYRLTSSSATLQSRIGGSKEGERKEGDGLATASSSTPRPLIERLSREARAPTVHVPAPERFDRWEADDVIIFDDKSDDSPRATVEGECQESTLDEVSHGCLHR